jgi:spoIIIJ-associated protein
MENQIHQIIETLLNKIGVGINKIRIEKTPEGGYRVNIETSHPNLMIGHRGETIGAMQHLVKLLFWKETDRQDISRPELSLDIESYRKRQEQNIIQLAERKVEMVRKLSSPQSLPAMSPYFRRVVHLHLAQDKYQDISTESQGDGDYRYIVIKPEIII